MRTLGAYLHPYELRYSKKAVTSALEDSILAQGSKAFKLDVLTPIKMPQIGRAQPVETGENPCSDNGVIIPGSTFGNNNCGTWQAPLEPLHNPSGYEA